jgi:predicted RNA-binding Zn ribbon-like protein
MFKLDDNLLKELGLGTLPAAEKNKMLSHIYETLEMRVGMKLAQKMSNEQLNEFESFIDRNDEAGALKWLETNFPDYKQVVASELESLKIEIKTSAPQIVEASLAAQQQAYQQQEQQNLPTNEDNSPQQPPVY